MKKSIIVFVVFCGGIACAIVYLNKNKSAPAAPRPMVAATPAPADASMPPENVPAQKMESSAAAPPAATTTTPSVAAIAATGEAKSDAAANPIHKAIDGLLSAKNGAE